MNAPVRIENPVAQTLEVLDAMPTDFDRLIQGSVNQLIFSDARMDRIMKMAEILAKGKVTVPAHLQNNVGDCMAIVLQAAQWNMDPFAVAQKTHLVSGKLGYEAQLVNAVIITRAPVTGRPQYEWFGDWTRVIGKFKEKTSQKGEILPAPTPEPEPEDPIADLILAISDCQTREDLEAHRAAVAGLKNGLKKRAVDAWKTVEATFPKAA